MTAQVLAGLCGPDSRVLVTRRSGSPASYGMPMLDHACARELLGKELPVQPSDDQFDVIWKSVGGHPLSLALINAAARAESPWEELAATAPGSAGFPTMARRWRTGSLAG